jgi:hypothetical protein
VLHCQPPHSRNCSQPTSCIASNARQHRKAQVAGNNPQLPTTQGHETANGPTHMQHKRHNPSPSLMGPGCLPHTGCLPSAACSHNLTAATTGAYNLHHLQRTAAAQGASCTGSNTLVNQQSSKPNTHSACRLSPSLMVPSCLTRTGRKKQASHVNKSKTHHRYAHHASSALCLTISDGARLPPPYRRASAACSRARLSSSVLLLLRLGRPQSSYLAAAAAAAAAAVTKPKQVKHFTGICIQHSRTALLDT